MTVETWGRLDRLQMSQRRATAFVSGGDWYTLRVAPMCPPSKELQVRGGRSYLGWNSTLAPLDDYEQRVYTVPDLTADLADPDSVTVEVSFTSAGYFQFFILELRTPAVVEEPTEADWSFYLHGTGDELETAGAAEDWLHSTEFQYSIAWKHNWEYVAYPLCGVVLQNDGQVDVSGAFLAIDVVNRGRSYTWPRDMRPRHSIYE